MFGKLGIGELIIILVIVLVVFGVGKLPQIGGAIGKSIREFRSAQRGEGEEATPKKEEATKNMEGKDTSVLK